MKVDNNVKTKEKGKKVILFKYSTISLWKRLVACYVLAFLVLSTSHTLII